MRFLLATICSGLLALPQLSAADAKPSLGIGDAAPPVKATKWLKGKEITAFEAGKVYVVEFWATWCGPCIAMMPHISRIQDEYRDKGVTIIGFSAIDNNNSEAKVTDFVETRGKKLHYTMAFADNRDTRDAYMKAAQRNGIPCCFVVDKAGKVAFIGHPVLLDEVLPKVVAGAWKGQEDADDLEKGLDEFREVAVLGRKDPEAALKAFDELREKRPTLARSVFFAPTRIALLLKLEKRDEVRTEATRQIELARKRDDGSSLARLAGMLAGSSTDKELLTLALRTAEDALKINGEKDVSTLLLLADVHFALGEKARAREFGAKAVAAANPRIRKQVEERVEKYDGENPDVPKSEDKKDS